ncbi:FGFR1 oncogene partner 2 homolog isoform X1 [Styela clava]
MLHTPCFRIIVNIIIKCKSQTKLCLPNSHFCLQGIQQENNAIRSLQHENDELRQSLTDHQNALELIMTKYRQQMMKFTKHKNIQITENAYQAEKQYQEENIELIDKIHEMVAVMRHAADVDDEQYLRDYEELSRLETENDILREMLMISKSSFGSRLITTEQKDSADTEKQENESEMVLTEDTTSDKTVIHEGNSPKTTPQTIIILQ